MKIVIPVTVELDVDKATQAVFDCISDVFYEDVDFELVDDEMSKTLVDNFTVTVLTEALRIMKKRR